MAQKKQNTFYWSPYDLLTYNRILNFIIGNRGAGKTYAMKKWCIDDYLKRKFTFVWVRRYKTEMTTISKFFDDIRDKYPEHDLQVKGNTALCDGQVFGVFIPLSVSARFKSTPFPECNKIIFDEFIIDKGSLHYLKNEVETFLELFETVARTRENVRAFLLANTVSFMNPYFSYFNTYPNPDLRFTLTKSICLEFVQNDEFKEAKRLTRFAKLIEGTQYADYAIENKSLRDNNEFIVPRTECSNLEHSMNLLYNGHKYGVWVNKPQGYLYIDHKVKDDSNATYAVTLEDGRTNTMFLKGTYTRRQVDALKSMFHAGAVFYDALETKAEFFEIMNHLGRI